MLVELSKADCALVIHKIAARIANSANSLTSKDAQKNRPQEHGILEALTRDIGHLENLLKVYRADAMSIFSDPSPVAELEEPEHSLFPTISTKREGAHIYDEDVDESEADEKIEF